MIARVSHRTGQQVNRRSDEKNVNERAIAFHVGRRAGRMYLLLVFRVDEHSSMSVSRHPSRRTLNENRETQRARARARERGNEKKSRRPFGSAHLSMIMRWLLAIRLTRLSFLSFPLFRLPSSSFEPRQQESCHGQPARAESRRTNCPFFSRTRLSTCSPKSRSFSTLFSPRRQKDSSSVADRQEEERVEHT